MSALDDDPGPDLCLACGAHLTPLHICMVPLPTELEGDRP